MNKNKCNKLLRLGLLALMVGLSLSLTACPNVNYSMNEDFSMSGTAEGIRAYNDGVIGMARTAKESPERQNEYLGYRATQESEITQRLRRGVEAVKKFINPEPQGS